MTLPSDRKKALWNISLLVLAAVFAWVVRSVEEVAASSDRWNKLIFPNLGSLSTPGFVFITGILPGLPFAFVAWRSFRTARSFGAPYRIGIACLIVVLGIVSFRDIAWTLWFGLTVFHSGGEF
jgi:hypothetical protein